MIKICRVFRRFLTSTCSLHGLKAEKKLDEGLDSCLKGTCKLYPSSGCPKIVIIGGGMAGLSAADRLATNGLGDITLIEASNRLGGRVMSCMLADSVVELGCGSLVCNISSPLFGLAMSASDIESEISFREQAEVPTFFLTSEGNTINEYRAEELLLNHILGEASQLGKEKTSLLHFLTLRINQELLSYPEEERYNAERLLYGMINELRGDCGGELSQVSAPLLGLQKNISGPEVELPQGMLSLLAPLLHAIPYHQLFHTTEVIKIEWKEEVSPGQPRALVHTATWEVHQADYVIITIPIGVLKEKAEVMFQPPLPQSKLDAINSIGSGVRNKIYAEYNEPWWGGSGCRIRLALSPQEMLQEGDWTRGIHYINASSRTIMEIRINGAEAKMLEQCTEEETALELTRFFRKLLGDSTIPFPNHIIVTRWGSEQFCKGSVVSLNVNSNEDHLEELRMPVPEKVPVLFFAGDATACSYFGSIEGARLSGIREADRILELTKQFDGPPKQE